jgi:hypothetical protein
MLKIQTFILQTPPSADAAVVHDVLYIIMTYCLFYYRRFCILMLSIFIYRRCYLFWVQKKYCERASERCNQQTAAAGVLLLVVVEFANC